MIPPSEYPITARYRRGLIIAAVLTACLFLIRFGYDYGVSDQEEFLPVLLSRLNPQVLTNDWFVGLQLDRLNVRSGFVTALQIFSWLIPVWLTVLSFHVAAFFLCTTAVFHLAWQATRSMIPAVAATIFTLVLTPYWTLGGNEILNRFLVPSTLAWGFSLWSLIFLFKQKPVTSGVLLGIASLIQPLIALQLVIVSTVFLVIDGILSASNVAWLKPTVRFLVPFSVVGAWLLAPLILEQLSGIFGQVPPDTGTTPDALTLLTEFRGPHHYLPESFPAVHYLRFFILVLIGTFGLLRDSELITPRFRHISKIILLTIAALLLVSFIGTTWLKVGLIVKLQLFKLTVLAKILLVIAGTAGVWAFLSQSVRERLTSVFNRPITTFAVWSLVALIGVGVAFVPSLAHRALPFMARSAGSEGQVIAWIRNNTPESAIFAIPPSLSGFRWRSRRPAFVDFKAVPFHDDALREWYRRLMLEAPLDGKLPGGTSAMYALDQAYESMTASTVQTLISNGPIDYFLRRTAFLYPETVQTVDMVFQNPDWYLYQTRSLPVTSN